MIRCMGPLLIALCVSNLAWAACPPSTVAADVTTAAEQVQHSYDAELETHDLPRLAAEARRVLECATVALTPKVVGAFLRSQGLALYLTEQPDAAAPWFAASRQVDPDSVLPQSIAPDQSGARPHPLRVAHEQAVAPGEPQPLPDMPVGWANVDGTRTDSWPGGRPYVLQVFDSKGRLVRTTVNDPDEAPDVALIEAPVSTPADTLPEAQAAPPAVPMAKRRPPVKIITGSALLVAGGATAMAIGLSRSSVCNKLDANGDGNLDCPAGAMVGFYGGLGVGAVGLGLVIAGLATELGGPAVHVAVGRQGVHFDMTLSF